MADPILIDVSRLIWRQWTHRLPTGIDRVCLAYLQHFAPRASAVVQFRRWRLVLNPADSVRLFDLLLNGSDRFRTRLAAILAAAATRPADTAKGQLYLNVGHTGLNSPYLGSWIAEHRLRAVFLIHDLIPITHPQYCRQGEADRHGQRITHALQSASAVIVNSHATERDLACHARDHGLRMPVCLVAWLGIDTPSAPPSPMGPDHPYFVTVGTIEARKNHLLLLQIWSELVNRLGPDAPDLLIIGQRGWEAEAAVAVLDNLGPLASHVRELGRCDDEAMIGLIAGAQALLMPSFVEGFGLPIVEALELGTPVIASDLDVFREIAGNIPDYRDPRDRSGWVDAILAYSTDGDRRRDQLHRAAGFKAPRWADHFERVEQLLAAL